MKLPIQTSNIIRSLMRVKPTIRPMSFNLYENNDLEEKLSQVTVNNHTQLQNITSKRVLASLYTNLFSLEQALSLSDEQRLRLESEDDLTGLLQAAHEILGYFPLGVPAAQDPNSDTARVRYEDIHGCEHHRDGTDLIFTGEQKNQALEPRHTDWLNEVFFNRKPEVPVKGSPYGSPFTTTPIVRLYDKSGQKNNGKKGNKEPQQENQQKKMINLKIPTPVIW